MIWKLLLVVFTVLILAFLYLKMSAVRVPGSEARERVAAGALLLDVRTANEFSGGHIEGAINIPVQELPRRLDELGNDKAREVVVYCQSGGRSAIAKRILQSNGFESIYDLGRIDQW